MLLPLLAASMLVMFVCGRAGESARRRVSPVVADAQRDAADGAADVDAWNSYGGAANSRRTATHGRSSSSRTARRRRRRRALLLAGAAGETLVVWRVASDVSSSASADTAGARVEHVFKRAPLCALSPSRRVAVVRLSVARATLFRWPAFAAAAASAASAVRDALSTALELELASRPTPRRRARGAGTRRALRDAAAATAEAAPPTWPTRPTRPPA